MNTTRYQKSIRVPEIASMGKMRTLKKGSNNAKLGFKITSKVWTGKRLYSLTLVERETCPTSCHHWDDCYGNNMPFAHRFTTANIDLILEREIEELMQKHKEGIVIRLHVLGDFFSVDYVLFWQEMMFKHPKLCIFGYTARGSLDPIGEAIMFLNMKLSERCVIRQSRNFAHNESNNWSYAAEESFEGASFVCPEQTGKLPSCAACGLCWSVPKTVKFLSH